MKNGVTKIIQLTDTHLFAEDALALNGIQSNLTFKAVIEKIMNEDIADTDAILLTGDVSQDETRASYEYAVACLEKLNKPIYWIPGNHDDAVLMEAVFNQSKYFKKLRHLTFFNWKFIFINSNQSSTSSGYIAEHELKILQDEILSSPSHLNLSVVMHHHPYETNTPLIDKYILKNREDFWHVIRGTNVKLIICGHVHGNYALTQQGVHIECGPATCFQFPIGTTSLEIVTKIGYKIYTFDADNYSAHAKMW